MATRKQLFDRILGSVVAASIGDAMGGAFEKAPAEDVRRRTGGDWIDELYPYPQQRLGPFSVWKKRAPAGTGTDDTRMNHLFLEAVVANAGRIDSRLLAAEYVGRYIHPERHYPGAVREMARRHYRDFYGVSCGQLGQPCPELPGVGPEVLRDRSFGCRWPTLVGLLALASAGALYDNQPLAAYRKAYELAYFDVGYAREACGLHAAAVSMAVGGADMTAILRRLGRMDPYRFSGVTFGGSLCPTVRRAGQLARKARSDRQLAVLLARELTRVHIFDPVDTLTVSLAANRFAAGDGQEAITIAANHRNVDDDGRLVELRDNDCTGYLAGSLAGALCGCKRLPGSWVETVIAANKRLYGIDAERNVHDFCKAVYGRRR